MASRGSVAEERSNYELTGDVITQTFLNENRCMSVDALFFYRKSKLKTRTKRAVEI